MGHFAAIIFFTSLLVALGFVLELTLRGSWTAIVNALNYSSPAPARPRAKVAPAQPRRWHAAF